MGNDRLDFFIFGMDRCMSVRVGDEVPLQPALNQGSHRGHVCRGGGICGRGGCGLGGRTWRSSG
jgi:hypothetical protein